MFVPADDDAPRRFLKHISHRPFKRKHAPTTMRKPRVELPAAGDLTDHPPAAIAARDDRAAVNPGDHHVNRQPFGQARRRGARRRRRGFQAGGNRDRYEATCNEYRGLLCAKDPALYAVISQEEWVLVTNNDRDFRALTMRAGLHSGLIVLPLRARSDQPLMLDAVLDHIDLHSSKADMSPEAWMTNRVVEYHEDDTISAAEWPPAST
jgi:Domain of unknown function (DUF5615)